MDAEMTVHFGVLGPLAVTSGDRTIPVGKNGLANHAADDTPTAYRMPFTWWEKYQRS